MKQLMVKPSRFAALLLLLCAGCMAGDLGCHDLPPGMVWVPPRYTPEEPIAILPFFRRPGGFADQDAATLTGQVAGMLSVPVEQGGGGFNVLNTRDLVRNIEISHIDSPQWVERISPRTSARTIIRGEIVDLAIRPHRDQLINIQHGYLVMRVDVYQADDGYASSLELRVNYPPERATWGGHQISVMQVSDAAMKQKLVELMARKIAWLFFGHGEPESE